MVKKYKFTGKIEDVDKLNDSISGLTKCIDKVSSILDRINNNRPIDIARYYYNRLKEFDESVYDRYDVKEHDFSVAKFNEMMKEYSDVIENVNESFKNISKNIQNVAKDDRLFKTIDEINKVLKEFEVLDKKYSNEFSKLRETINSKIEENFKSVREKLGIVENVSDRVSKDIKLPYDELDSDTKRKVNKNIKLFFRLVDFSESFAPVNTNITAFFKQMDDIQEHFEARQRYLKQYSSYGRKKNELSSLIDRYIGSDAFENMRFVPVIGKYARMIERISKSVEYTFEFMEKSRIMGRIGWTGIEKVLSSGIGRAVIGGAVAGAEGGIVGGVIGGAMFGSAAGPIGVVVGVLVGLLTGISDLVEKYGSKFSGFFAAYKKLFDVVMGLAVKPFADMMGMLLIPVLRIILMMLLPLIKNWSLALKTLKEMNIPMILRPFFAPMLAIVYTIYDIIDAGLKYIFGINVNLKEIVSNELIKAAKKFYNFIATIGEKVNSFLSSIGLNFGSFKDGVVGILIELNAWIREKIVDIEAWIFEKGIDIIAWFSNKIIEFNNWIKQVIGVDLLGIIFSYVEDEYNKFVWIVGFVSGEVGKVGNAVVGIIEGAVKVVIELLGKIPIIGGHIKNIVSTVGGIISEYVKNVNDETSNSFNFIKGMIESGKKLIEGFKNSSVKDISEWKSSALENINRWKQTSISIMERQKNLSLNILDRFKSSTESLFGGMKNDTVNNISNMSNKAISILDSQKSSSLDVLNKFKLSAEGLFSGLKSDTVSKVNEMVKNSVNSSNRVVDIIKQSSDKVTGIVNDIHSSVISAIYGIGKLQKELPTDKNKHIWKDSEGHIIAGTSGRSIDLTLLESSGYKYLGYDKNTNRAYFVTPSGGVAFVNSEDGNMYYKVGSTIMSASTYEKYVSEGKIYKGAWTSSANVSESEKYKSQIQAEEARGLKVIKAGYDPKLGTYVTVYDDSDCKSSDCSHDCDCSHECDCSHDCSISHSDCYPDSPGMLHSSWTNDIGYQIGGEVPETGRYILHGGELVIPRWKVVDVLAKMSDDEVHKNNVEINIDMTVNVSGNVDKTDIDELAEKIKEKLMEELRMRGVF